MEFIDYWVGSISQAFSASWFVIGEVETAIALLGGAFLASRHRWFPNLLKGYFDHPVFSETWRLGTVFALAFPVIIFVTAPYWQWEAVNTARIKAEGDLDTALLDSASMQKQVQFLQNTIETRQEQINWLQARGSHEESSEFQIYFDNQNKMLAKLNEATDLPPAPAIKDLAENSIAPLSDGSRPDTFAAIADIKNQQIKNAAQMQESLSVEAHRDKVIAAEVGPKYDFIIKSFHALLQIEATKYHDTVTSNYKGMPDSLSRYQRLSFFISWVSNPQWSFGMEVQPSVYSDETILEISSQETVVTDPKTAVKGKFSLSGEGNERMLRINVTIGGVPIVTFPPTTIKDVKSINSALEDIIASQYLRLGTTPPSSSPNKPPPKP